jgi:hypothetical protein
MGDVEKCPNAPTEPVPIEVLNAELEQETAGPIEVTGPDEQTEE